MSTPRPRWPGVLAVSVALAAGRAALAEARGWPSWADLLAWRPGQRLPLQSLSAEHVDLQMQRLADGHLTLIGRGNFTAGLDIAQGLGALR